MKLLVKNGWLVFSRKGVAVGPWFVPRKPVSETPLPSSIPMLLGACLEKKVSIRRAGTDLMWPARIWKAEHGGYKAGPFIAILTSSTPKGFCGNISNFSDIIRTGRRMGVTVYVLTPEGLRQRTSSVRGFLMNPRKNGPRWLAATLPLPDVVYNRIPSRRLEQRPAEQEALATLSTTPGVQLFNPSFFNKWTLFLHLEHSEKLSPLLPETAEWKDGSHLKKMIEKHSTLFLKPVDGKAGDGMIRITRLEPEFEVVHQTLQGKHRLTLGKNKLHKWLKTRIGNQNYVLQQGINLARFRGRPFDLRLLLQKGKTGGWEVTGIGVRVAGEKAISTHVPMGGSIASFGEVLQNLFGEQAPSVTEKIKSTALEIASHIEREEGRNHGEMSMDLGLESDGRLWFFEANAKPMKFDEPDIRQRSLRRLIEYSLYLSGYVSTAVKGRKK